jgi:hypothetical protein
MIIYYLLSFQNTKKLSKTLIKRTHKKTANFSQIYRPLYGNFMLSGS